MVLSTYWLMVIRRFDKCLLNLLKVRNLGKKLPVQKEFGYWQESLGSGGSGAITEFIGATGGLISEYRLGQELIIKNIYFLNHGTFTVTNPEVTDVDVLLVGGGGGGSTGGGGEVCCCL